MHCLRVADSAPGVAGLSSSEAFDIRFDFTTIPSSLPDLEALKVAAKDRADLRALRISERKVEAETDLVRAEGKPDLTASARY